MPTPPPPGHLKLETLCTRRRHSSHHHSDVYCALLIRSSVTRAECTPADPAHAAHHGLQALSTVSSVLEQPPLLPALLAATLIFGQFCTLRQTAPAPRAARTCYLPLHLRTQCTKICTSSSVTLPTASHTMIAAMCRATCSIRDPVDAHAVEVACHAYSSVRTPTLAPLLLVSAHGQAVHRPA